MELVNTSGFVEMSTSLNKKIIWYYAKNFSNIQNYIVSPLTQDINLLKQIVEKNPTSAKEIFLRLCNRGNCRRQIYKIISQTRGAPREKQLIFTLVYRRYKYTPIGSSSYLKLPAKQKYSIPVIFALSPEKVYIPVWIEYTDSWAKLEEDSLPRKEDFYSTLTETIIEEIEYRHAIKVWDHFRCTSLGEYSNLYLKIDVLLLADIFENFRNIIPI